MLKESLVYSGINKFLFTEIIIFGFISQFCPGNLPVYLILLKNPPTSLKMIFFLTKMKKNILPGKQVAGYLKLKLVVYNFLDFFSHLRKYMYKKMQN